MGLFAPNTSSSVDMTVFNTLVVLFVSVALVRSDRQAIREAEHRLLAAHERLIATATVESASRLRRIDAAFNVVVTGAAAACVFFAYEAARWARPLDRPHVAGGPLPPRPDNGQPEPQSSNEST